MSILTFVAACVFWGVVLWIINAFLPISAEIKRVMNIGVAVLLVLWLLFSVIHGVPDVVVTAR